jgi:hypothetical protein
MAAIVIVKKTGPATYVPADDQVILGGQVVVPSGTAGRVAVGGADSLVVLGIAVTDGKAPEDITTAPVSGVLDGAQLAAWVTVAYGGMEVDGVKYAANATFGQKLKSAATGQVTPMVVDDDPRLEVGTCTQLGGVLANATGLVRTK